MYTYFLFRFFPHICFYSESLLTIYFTYIRSDQISRSVVSDSL